MSIKKTHSSSVKKKHKKPGAKPRVQEIGKSETEIKADIMLLVSVNWSEDDIAKVFGLTHKELKSKYQYELENGLELEKAKLMKALRRKAHTGDVPACRLLISLGDESSFLRKGLSARRGAAAPMRPIKPEKIIAKKVSEPKLGKKQEQVLAAKAGHKGTTWDDHLKH